jgi:predicted transcriptional regulator
MKFNDFLEEQLKDPDFKKEYDRLEPEYEIIKQLIDARNELDLTQAELAKRAGTDQGHISRLERGNYNPSLKFLKKIAEGLGKELHISFVSKA